MPSGATSLCANASYTQYVTTGVATSTSYYWELSPDAAGTFVQGNAAIYINWADDFAGAVSLRVKAMNENCEGAFSDPLQIMINNLPSAFNVTGGGIYCAQGGVGMPVELSGSEANTSYTLIKDGTPTSTVVAGTGNAISFGNQPAAIAYTVQASNQLSCVSEMTGNAIVTADPQAPEKPLDPAGPSVIITSTSPTSEFVTQSTFARSYAWSLIPANAGILTGTDGNVTVTWNQAYIGTSSIKAQGVNTCGNGPFSNFMVTQVNIGVGQTELQKNIFGLAPNPASNTVTILSSKEMTCDLTVVNTAGKLIISKPGLKLSNETQLDVSQLASGLYNVVFRDQTGIKTLKLVIEK
jgi:hypothetical protein